MVDHNRQFDPDFEISQLENDLRQALQPRSAPPSFAASVMARIPLDAHNELPAPRRARIFHFPASVRLAAVASLLIVILAGTLAWQQHQRRLAGERARRQVFIALQIAHSTLQQVAENISTIQPRKDLQP